MNMQPPSQYGVIVIGGGHAGCEAALAAARLGVRTLLLTINLDRTAQMSCNPAVGGIAKGHLVREIDALGGEMGVNADAATLQFRMLNRSKGPAVWSPRAQCDKLAYQRRMQLVLERQDNVFVHQGQAVRFVVRNGRVCGVETEFGDAFSAQAIVVATGTFLNAVLHYGLRRMPGGRSGDPAAEALAASLRDDLKLEIGRLKTGTPPRILARTIDFSSMDVQGADEGPARFSFRDPVQTVHCLRPDKPAELPCYLTVSTERTAEIVRENLDKSPMYAGRIDATGTRYCPSFEDKIVRFPHHPTHQIHVEPEGLSTEEYYLNGISTSLPPEVQREMVRSLPGFENAHLTRYAYAIEYDFVYPHVLSAGLAVRRWPNLFLAGQINGTSGYEEAAAQGLLAGINAARLAEGEEDPVVIGRDQAYIGVLVDDLITKDIVEPYRMFTSRAEYRLMLRQDNAHRRLMPLGYRLGLISYADHQRVAELERAVAETRSRLQETFSGGQRAWDVLKRPDSSYADLNGAPAVAADVVRQLEIEARYEGYVRRQLQQAESMRKLAHWRIPADFSYDLNGLRAEARTKLEQRRPATLAQAARIDGVTPSEIALLQVHLSRRPHLDPL